MKKVLFAIIIIILFTGMTFVPIGTSIEVSTHKIEYKNSTSIDSNNIYSSYYTNQLVNWTFMVYLDGDSDLEDWAINAINKMELVGSDLHLNIVVQMDDYNIWGGQTRRYFITYDTDPTNISSVLADNDTSEKDMADGETLIDFICWAVGNYPAEQYCLVLFNHGCGWRGVCWDESNENVSDRLTMTELKHSMNILYDLIGKPLDLLCFNACTMGNIEVFYQLKDYVNIGIASQDVQYNYLPYDLFLGDLKNNPSFTPEQFAREIVNDSFNSYNHAVDEISAYHTNDIADVVEKVDFFVGDLIQYLPCYFYSIRSAIKKSLHFDYNFDIYDFVNEIKNRYLINQEIKDRALDVMDAIDNAVIEIQSKEYGNSNFAHGLSIHLDTRASCYSPEYEDLDFAKDTMWDEFLRAYLERSKKLVVRFPGQDVEYNNHNTHIILFSNPLILRVLEKLTELFLLIERLINFK